MTVMERKSAFLSPIVFLVQSQSRMPIKSVVPATEVFAYLSASHTVSFYACPSTHQWVWSPCPRRMCGNLGRICHRTSSRPRGGAAGTRCRSYTPYTASGTSGSHTPATCSCPSRTGDLKFMDTKTCAEKQTQSQRHAAAAATNTHTHK